MNSDRIDIDNAPHITIAHTTDICITKQAELWPGIVHSVQLTPCRLVGYVAIVIGTLPVKKGEPYRGYKLWRPRALELVITGAQSVGYIGVDASLMAEWYKNSKRWLRVKPKKR